MKQIVLSVEDNKFDFFLELISNLKFVKLQNMKSAVTSDNKDIFEAMQMAKLAADGKIKSRPAEDFLNEL